MNNPNPRIGVLLRIHGASVRLTNVLRYHRMMGLKRFEKCWPEPRRRKEIFGWGKVASDEWHRVLLRREMRPALERLMKLEKQRNRKPIKL